MALSSAADLNECARLLSRLLDADAKGRQAAPGKSAASRARCRAERKGAIVKRKYRKPKPATAEHKAHCCYPEPEDSFEVDLQRVILEKRRLMQAPTINDAAWTRDPPERDVPHRDAGDKSVSTPYNKRLTTSTPHRSPVRIAGKAEISLTDGAKLQGMIDEHAMNSYEYLKGLNPELQPPAPKLHHADVQYQPNPHKIGDQRYAFGQQIQDAMRGVYIENLKASLPAPGTQQAQFSLYSEEDLMAEKPCRDVSNKPAKELRPPISPFKVNKTTSQPTRQPANQPAIPQPSTAPREETAPLHSHLNMEANRDPILSGSQFADVSHLSRAQLLQAALKVALQSGALDGLPAYMTPGPISPFRPGTAGFSAYGGGQSAENLNMQVQPEVLEESTLIEESELQDTPREHEKPLRRTFPEYDGAKLRTSVADLHIPDPPQPNTKTTRKVTKSSRIDALAAPKKVKNKKIQHAPGAKKKPDMNGKTKKVVKGTAKNKGVLLTHNIGTQAISARITEANQGKADSKSSSFKSASFVVKSSSEKSGQSKNPNRLKSSSDIGIQATPKQTGILKKAIETEESEKEVAAEEMKENETAGTIESVEENKENEIQSEDLPITQSAYAKDVVLKEKSNKTKPTDDKKKLTGTELAEVSDNIGSNYKIPILDQSKYNSLFIQIKHLTKELKVVPGMKLDKEGKRLLKELDEKVNKGKLDLQTDLDLAVQPLRSENAQLRRRVRILTQQLKDKEVELQNAEKPDPNFMVVHLQMQNFNLENDLKATKQVVSKLKEEVHVYQAEMQKLSTDRTDLLNLVGKPGEAATTTQVLREKQGLEAQVAAFKQAQLQLARQLEDAEARLQLLHVTCRQKDQELDNMQHLVQTLQASMKKLLQEMQSGSRESFMTSYTGVSDAKVTSQNSRPSQGARDVSSLVSSLPPQQPSVLNKPPAPPYNQPQPSSQSQPHELVTSSQAEALQMHPDPVRPSFDEVRDRVRASLEIENTPALKSNQVVENTQRAKPYAVSDSGSYGNQDGSIPSNGIERQHGAALSLPQIDEKVGLYLMDQPGLNYSKIAESLNEAARKRRSLSTNPDTDITEYKAYPGTSPIQQSAFDKLDPFVKDLLRSQRLKNQDNQREAGRVLSAQLSHPKAPSSDSTRVSTLTPSITTVTESETKESTSTGPTVKELLTPLADRMQRIQSFSDTERSRAVRAINFDAAPEAETKPKPSKVEDVPVIAHVGQPIVLSRPSMEISDDSYTVELKKDIEKLHYEDSSSTLLTTETSDEQVTPLQNMTTGNEGDSRYSVTDYFKKYPDAASKSILARKNEAKRLSKCSEEIYDGDQSEDGQSNDVRVMWAGRQKSRGKISDSERDEMIGRWAEQVVISPGGVPVIFDTNSEQPSPQESPQVKLYRGTDLDTSISTINDRDSLLTSNTEMTSNSVTTSGSLSSVDDRIFRQGLANLDANIERVQKSLREAML